MTPFLLDFPKKKPSFYLKWLFPLCAGRPLHSLTGCLATTELDDILDVQGLTYSQLQLEFIFCVLQDIIHSVLGA